MSDLLLKNCRQLLTVAEKADDLIGFFQNTSLLIRDERIEMVGSFESITEKYPIDAMQILDCSEHVVMPGYVDSHTHLVFGESRVDEYAASLTLEPDQIKQVVGRVGLAASIHSTTQASDEELLQSSLTKLRRMLASGTTTVEIKSGYGIDQTHELRQLRIARQLSELTPQTILATYLGAHYYDTEMGKDRYIDFMIDKVMPVIQAEKLADFCDIWVDSGYYTAEDAMKLLSAAKQFGMRPALHTECYSAIGGARAAAELGAANAGHLNYLTPDDAKLLARAGVIGIVLPGTDFSVQHKTPFDPSYMVEAGMTLAIATNLNPGNWIEAMPVAMTLACRNHRMTVEAAIRGATLNGAKALAIESDYGSLEAGKFADIQILRADSYKNCVYKFGVNEVETVIKKGRIVVEAKKNGNQGDKNGL